MDEKDNPVYLANKASKLLPNNRREALKLHAAHHSKRYIPGTYDKPRAKGNKATLIKQSPAWDVDGNHKVGSSSAAGLRADLVMGSLAHAVVVAGGWCRISTNFATPSHMLDRLVNYKQVLMDEQRNAFFNYHNWAGPDPWVRQLGSSLLLISCMVRALEAAPTFTSRKETACFVAGQLFLLARARAQRQQLAFLLGGSQAVAAHRVGAGPTPCPLVAHTVSTARGLVLGVPLTPPHSTPPTLPSTGGPDGTNASFNATPYGKNAGATPAAAWAHTEGGTTVEDACPCFVAASAAAPAARGAHEHSAACDHPLHTVPAGACCASLPQACGSCAKKHLQPQQHQQPHQQQQQQQQPQQQQQQQWQASLHLQRPRKSATPMQGTTPPSTAVGYVPATTAAAPKGVLPGKRAPVASWAPRFVCAPSATPDPTMRPLAPASFWLACKDHQCDICGDDLELQHILLVPPSHSQAPALCAAAQYQHPHTSTSLITEHAICSTSRWSNQATAWPQLCLLQLNISTETPTLCLTPNTQIAAHLAGPPGPQSGPSTVCCSPRPAPKSHPHEPE
ncbi:hypothetical protein DUNSADRAFT_17422 [Dunaliella salina]|uniref:Uncharacterized protein n=1 Tax=Dunaliella salina TaxID=3046 RepID=A0ABQ7H022_DUNSA|nr:hypothetical protein DUNSADRAFT_17422 [Dunaliella salina]|eukprot:KAF5840205.1 hypothetical protein DUNSADRAFT_17422 [Dunaliella salina]